MYKELIFCQNEIFFKNTIDKRCTFMINYKVESNWRDTLIGVSRQFYSPTATTRASGVITRRKMWRSSRLSCAPAACPAMLFIWISTT